MRAKRDSPPRTKAEAWEPTPPVRAVATPGTSWSRVRKEEGARSTTRSRSRAETVTPSVEVAASLRVAVTTTCSRTGAGASVTSSTASPSADPHARLRGEHEAGRLQRRPCIRRRQLVHPVASIRAGQDALRVRGAAKREREMGDGQPVARPHGAGERSGSLGVGDARKQQSEGDGKSAHESSLRRPFAGNGVSVGGHPRPARRSAAPSREKPRGRCGQGRFPGSRVIASSPDLPRVSPSGGASLAPEGVGSPATVAGPRRLSNLLPFYPPEAGGTLTNARTMTGRAGRCQRRRARTDGKKLRELRLDAVGWRGALRVPVD